MFEGIITALVTPFDENINVDFDTFSMLIERQILLGVKNILILGSTGECESISQNDRIKMIKLAKRQLPSFAKLIVGTGAPDTETAVNQTMLAKKYGADACLVVSPYYSKCTQSGIIKHFEEISNRVDIPIIVYNVPSRTNINICADTIVELAKLKNIVALKEASTDITHIIDVFHKKALPIFCGNDNLAEVFYALGGKGIISVTSNVFPGAMLEVHQNVKRRNEILNKLYNFNNLMFCEPNPIPVKYALSSLGIIQNILRLPLTPLDEKHHENIDKELERLKEFL